MTRSYTHPDSDAHAGVGDVVEPVEPIHREPSAYRELKGGWRLLLSAMIGSGLSAILAYALGVFIAPISRDYGWTADFIVLGFNVSTILGAIGALFCGRLIDRLGARTLALAGTMILAISTVALGIIPSSKSAYIASYAAVAIGHTLLSPIVWQKLVVERFERARGLAVSIVLCGPNFAGALAPVSAALVIEKVNWHVAYLAMAFYMIVITLPLTWLFFRDTPRSTGEYPVSREGQLQSLTGPSLQDVVRTREFWLMCASFAFAAVGIGGYTIHFVPILLARGLPPLLAASMLGALSAAAICGRLLTGVAMDHLFAPRIAAFALVLPVASSVLLLLLVPTYGIILLAAVLIGLSSGAEYNMLGYLTSRYFGLRHFGTIGSLLFCLFSLGCMIGQQLPALLGHGSYDVVVAVFGACFLTAATTMLFCRPYPWLDAVVAAGEKAASRPVEVATD